MEGVCGCMSVGIVSEREQQVALLERLDSFGLEIFVYDAAANAMRCSHAT